jgi:hypothetical protein
LPDARELWWKAELLAQCGTHRDTPSRRSNGRNPSISASVGPAPLCSWALLWKSVATPSSVIIIIIITIVSLRLLAATTAFTLRRS